METGAGWVGQLGLDLFVGPRPVEGVTVGVVPSFAGPRSWAGPRGRAIAIAIATNQSQDRSQDEQRNADSHRHESYSAAVVARLAHQYEHPEVTADAGEGASPAYQARSKD